MRLAQVISSGQSLLGQRVKVEGVLHSDTVNVWLNEYPRSEEEQLVVNDPRIPALLLSTFPPRLGDVFAYYFQSGIQGVLNFDEDRNIFILTDVDSLVIDYNGSPRRLL